MAMDAHAGQAVKAPDVMPQQIEADPVKDVDCSGLSFMQTFQSPAAGKEGVNDALREVRSACGYCQSPAASWETGAASQLQLVGADSKELSYAASSGKRDASGKHDSGGKGESSGKIDSRRKGDSGAGRGASSGKDESALEKNKLNLMGLGILLMKIL